MFFFLFKIWKKNLATGYAEVDFDQRWLTSQCLLLGWGTSTVWDLDSQVIILFKSPAGPTKNSPGAISRENQGKPWAKRTDASMFDEHLLVAEKFLNSRFCFARGYLKKRSYSNSSGASWFLSRFGPWNLRKKGLLQFKTQLCQIDPFSKGSK